MFKNIVMSLVFLSFSFSILEAKTFEGFEDKAVLKNWEIEGEAVISKEQKHGGKTSLSVAPGSTALFRFGAENSYGSVTIWVYDSSVNKGNSPGKNWNGPYFGLVNSDDDKMVILPIWRPYLKPDGWCFIFTAESQWFSPWNAGVKRKAEGWVKFTFSFPNDKALGVTVDNQSEMKSIGKKVEFFKLGANGVCLSGGTDLEDRSENFFFDDLEIDVRNTGKKKE